MVACSLRKLLGRLPEEAFLLVGRTYVILQQMTWQNPGDFCFLPAFITIVYLVIQACRRENVVSGDSVSSNKLRLALHYTRRLCRNALITMAPVCNLSLL